jgi:protein SCO1/2
VRRAGLLILALLALLAIPAVALADGDPGSDELVYQTLFYGAGDNLTVAQQVHLNRLLEATTALKKPVRVAIIGQRADLGFVTLLWRKPAAYAQYLGAELEFAYSGRLIVVMPQGVAFYWYKHGLETISGTGTGASASELTGAAVAAVTKVEAASGISAATLQRMENSKTLHASAVAAAHQAPNGAVAASAAPTAGAGPTASASATNVSPVIVVVGLIALLGAVFWVPPVWRRRGVLRQGGIALPGLGIGVAAIGALVVLAVVIHSGDSDADQGLSTNPRLAAVNPLLDPRLAPNFKLTDETGRAVSLKQYRGKAVILSFTDDECQTICPLTTQAMVDARDSLGAAKSDVQLLGVNANAKSTSIDDVLTYTQLHGMLGQWHFLTGTDTQLSKIWGEYGISDDLSSTSSIIDHTPAVWIIGPDGRARATSVTYASYASIPQFGQELAQEVSQILPSHPKVRTHYSYNPIKGISPRTRTTLPKVGGGTVTLGTGKPHLYLFFASWDEQSTPIKAKMEQLNAYARQAKRLGLPPLTAIDEASVEPNPTTVTSFLAGMHLDYPVAIDRTGQVADGYGIEGEPWFVLAVPGAKNTAADPTADTPFAQEVYTQGWPTIANLEKNIPAALKPTAPSSGRAEVAKELAGSPPALASLHAQSSLVLSGGAAALVRRLKALKGYPVVVNVWASDCTACQAEFNYFATESAAYGSKVAFIGMDYADSSATDARGFLYRHHVSYPSYGVGDGDAPSSLLPGGVSAEPTTVFLNAAGKPQSIHVGSYESAQQLGQDFQAFALQSSS